MQIRQPGLSNQWIMALSELVAGWRRFEWAAIISCLFFKSPPVWIMIAPSLFHNFSVYSLNYLWSPKKEPRSINLISNPSKRKPIETSKKKANPQNCGKNNEQAEIIVNFSHHSGLFISVRGEIFNSPNRKLVFHPSSIKPLLSSPSRANKLCRRYFHLQALGQFRDTLLRAVWYTASLKLVSRQSCTRPPACPMRSQILW